MIYRLAFICELGNEARNAFSAPPACCKQPPSLDHCASAARSWQHRPSRLMATVAFCRQGKRK
eukprot:6198674-Pleurochrysis_carterae.AAC.2